MQLALDTDQRLQAETARSFVKSEFPGNVGVIEVGARRRQVEDAWRKMAELGWLGICIPEEFGGVDLGLPSLSIIFEELGAGLINTPLLSTVALAGDTLARFGSDDQKQRWLPAIADGSVILSVAFQEGRFDIDPTHVTTKAEWRGSRFVLSGEKTLVLDAPAASAIIVSARTSPPSHGKSGISLFLVPVASAGMRIDEQRLIDGRVAAKLRMKDLMIAEEALVGELDAGQAALDHVIERATILLCAEMLGGMQRAFERTVEYLTEREQFGVKIGTFQALQHRASRLYIDLTLARPAVRAAALADDHDAVEYQKSVSHAKAMCGDAYLKIAAEAIQLHGGLGMTEEFGIGRYLRSARVCEALFGDGHWHRKRWADLSGY